MKKKFTTGGKILIAAGLILIAGIIQYILFNVFGFGDGRSLAMTDTGKFVSYGIGSNAQFYSYDDDHFYFCTKDGIEYVSSDGATEWKEIYSLSNPDMVTAGEMVAVGDSMGGTVRVFNSEGLLYSVDLDYPLLTFSINRTGILSVILQLDAGYSAHIYNRRNTIEPLARYEIHDALMHPVSVDVSEDGRFAVIAMLNLNVRLESRVMFYYTNETDAWGTDNGMVAAQDYPGEFVLDVRFMEDNRALVFTDGQVSCFIPGDNISWPEAWSFPLHNEIGLMAFYGGSHFALTMGDKLLNDPEAAEPGEVFIYDVKGTGLPTGQFSLGRKATSLSMGRGCVLVGANHRFYALNKQGERLWDYTATADARSVYFLDDTNTVLMAGGNRANIMRREKERADAEAREELLTEDLETEDLETEGLEIEPD